jgi:hypothetical protein
VSETDTTDEEEPAVEAPGTLLVDEKPVSRLF